MVFQRLVAICRYNHGLTVEGMSLRRAFLESAPNEVNFARYA